MITIIGIWFIGFCVALLVLSAFSLEHGLTKIMAVALLWPLVIVFRVLIAIVIFGRVLTGKSIAEAWAEVRRELEK